MRRTFAQVPVRVWASLGLVSLLAAGYFGFHALYVKVSRSVERPFSGPARRNPFYVLQRYLEERGHRVQVARRWPQELAADMALLWFTDDPVPEAVRAWLADGGQLWTFSDPDGDPAINAWEATLWEGDADPDAGTSHGLEEDADPADAGYLWPEDGRAEQDEHPTIGVDEADTAFDVSDWLTAWCRDQPAGCLQAAQFQYGDGCLTLVRSLGLENEQVYLDPTPARIDALLACPARPASVLIVTDVGSPWFGAWLIKRAPEAMLAFAALLLCSLWRAGVYFGQRKLPPDPARRQLLEHVTAVGTLAGRVGTAPLLAAARSELHQRLRHRLPHASDLNGDALVQVVAHTTDLPPAEIRRALLDDPDSNRQELLAIARAIQALWRKT